MNESPILDEALNEGPALEVLPWGVKAVLVYLLWSLLWLHGMLFFRDGTIVVALSLSRNVLFLSGHVVVGIALWQLRKTADGMLMGIGIGYLIAVGVLCWITYQWVYLYGVMGQPAESGIFWWLTNGTVNNPWFHGVVSLLVARCLVLRYPHQVVATLVVRWLVIGAVIQGLYGVSFLLRHQVVARSDGHMAMLLVLGLTLLTMVLQWRNVVPHQRKVLFGFFVFNALLLPFWYAPHVPKEAVTFTAWSWVGVLLILYWVWQARRAE